MAKLGSSLTMRILFMFTNVKFVRVTFLTFLLFLPAHVLAQTPNTSPSRQSSTDLEYQTGAVLWTQSSAEYRALAFQAFTLARLRVDQDLAQHRSRRRSARPAVIVDADETVL